MLKEQLAQTLAGKNAVCLSSRNKHLARDVAEDDAGETKEPSQYVVMAGLTDRCLIV